MGHVEGGICGSLGCEGEHRLVLLHFDGVCLFDFVCNNFAKIGPDIVNDVESEVAQIGGSDKIGNPT